MNYKIEEKEYKNGAVSYIIKKEEELAELPSTLIGHTEEICAELNKLAIKLAIKEGILEDFMEICNQIQQYFPEQEKTTKDKYTIPLDKYYKIMKKIQIARDMLQNQNKHIYYEQNEKQGEWYDKIGKAKEPNNK